MHVRLIRSVAVVSISAALLAGCGSDAKKSATTTTSGGATTSGGTATSSGAQGALSEYCTQAEQIAPVLILTGLVAGLGSATSGTDQANADAATGAIPLLFSQQLEKYYASMSTVAGGALAPEAKKIAAVYATGPQRLKKSGFTDSEIAALAKLDPATATKSSAANSGKNINDATFKAEATAFGQEIAKVTKGSSGESAAVEQDYQALSAQCAASATGGVKACDLLTAAQVTAALGVDAKSSGEEPALGGGAGCSWDGSGDSRNIGITVASGARFDQLKSQYESSSANVTPVDGVGDQAFTISGYSSPTGGSTSGRTIVVSAQGKTLIIGVQRADDPVEDATLTALADQAITKLK